MVEMRSKEVRGTRKMLPNDATLGRDKRLISLTESMR
jgi:hypothetical protein